MHALFRLPARGKTQLLRGQTAGQHKQQGKQQRQPPRPPHTAAPAAAVPGTGSRFRTGRHTAILHPRSVGRPERKQPLPQVIQPREQPHTHQHGHILPCALRRSRQQAAGQRLRHTVGQQPADGNIQRKTQRLPPAALPAVTDKLGDLSKNGKRPTKGSRKR